MVKTSRMVYTLRGWMAFVAFIQIGTAIRCHVEKDIFMGVKSYAEDGVEKSVGFTFSRLYSILNMIMAVIIVQCALHIHYRTIRHLTLLSLAMSVAFMLSELLYYKSVPALEIAPGVHIGLQVFTFLWVWISPRFFIPLSEEDEEKSYKAKNGSASPFESEAYTTSQFKAQTTAAARKRRQRRLE